MTAVHLMTRGTPRRLDYRFLGAAPETRWWRPAQDWILLDGPETVVLGTDAGANVLLSGIPSHRRDAAGTPIRFTLVVEGADAETTARLARIGLDDTARSRLGGLLDTEFPPAWVDAAIGDAARSTDLPLRLARVVAGLAGLAPDEPEAHARTGSGTSWVGSAEDERAREEFVGRVAELGNGGHGWALTTATVSSVGGARRAEQELGPGVALLLADGGPDDLVLLGGEVLRGKAPAGRRAGPTLLILLLMVVGLVVTTAALLTGWGLFPGIATP